MRQERLGRGMVAAVLAGTLLIPTAGSVANPNKKLRKVEKALDTIQDDLAKKRARASTLQEEVDALSESLARIQVRVNDLKFEVKATEAEVSGAQERIDETQTQIDEVQEAATAQAVAMYKAGATETLDALFGASTLGELDDRVEMLGIAAQESTGDLIRYGRLKVKIRMQNADLFDKRDQLEALLEEKNEAMTDLTRQRRDLNRALDELNKRIGKEASREQHLARERAEMTGKIIEYQAQQSVAALGTSSRGFIWPLNGRVTSYYGPRWGRMHSGLDIDGYTGQPLIAAKEGRVILASSYSGYGNAVIIDHGGGYSTLYAHMSRSATTNGAYVEQGSLIGYVGCSGSCTGDHVHFEVRVNGRPVNPLPYMP
jgi:murein DD-endopeptidase MepM/ murein hydrolase activator NlpD